jgi:hypothetical protein
MATERISLHGGAQFVSPTRLAIVTTGSSSCPSVPDELTVLLPRVIRIHLTTGSWVDGKLVAHAPPSGACTADLGTTPMLVAIDPDEVDVHHRVKVLLFYPTARSRSFACADRCRPRASREISDLIRGDGELDPSFRDRADDLRRDVLQVDRRSGDHEAVEDVLVLVAANLRDRADVGACGVATCQPGSIRNQETGSAMG